MDKGDLAKNILWLWLLASVPLAAQITPFDLNPVNSTLIPIVKQSLGGALSTRNNQTGIEFTYGQLPALGETLGMRVNRLEIESPVLRLTVGESFNLDQLVVRAYGITGELIERVPLRIEFEGPEGLVNIEALEQTGKNLSAITPGIGRLWLESMLPSSRSEPFSLPIVLIVRGPGSPRYRPSLKIYENSPALPE
jgi:hypothetical protein